MLSAVLTVYLVVFVLSVLYCHYVQRGPVRKHESARLLFDKPDKENNTGHGYERFNAAMLLLFHPSATYRVNLQANGPTEYLN